MVSKSLAFIVVEILGALVLRMLGTYLFSFHFNDYPIMESVFFMSLINATATLLATWTTGFVHLKYIGLLNHMRMAVVLSLAGLFVSSMLVRIWGVFFFSAPVSLNIVIGQLPVAGTVAGFNYFLFKQDRQIQ